MLECPSSLGILCSFTLADVGNGRDFWSARLAVGRLCHYSREETTITWTWVLGVDNASEEQEACLREGKGESNGLADMLQWEMRDKMIRRVALGF